MANKIVSQFLSLTVEEKISHPDRQKLYLFILSMCIPKTLIQ